MDPRIFAVFGNQAWVHNFPYTETFYLARATLASELRSYSFYWDWTISPRSLVTCSRSKYFWIFPVTVIGKLSTKTT